MTPEDLQALPRPVARLVQIGLKTLGHYDFTTRGRPGPKTIAAYLQYLETLETLPPSSGTMAGELVRLATSQLGIREVPTDSNRGERVEAYQAATWYGGTGWPWCAAFLCWLFREAGAADSWRPKTPGAWDFENWARKHPDKVTLYKPASHTRIKPGDVVIYTFSHIGLAVEAESGGRVDTIEGNTDAAGSREGGGVYRKNRNKKKIRSVIRIK